MDNSTLILPKTICNYIEKLRFIESSKRSTFSATSTVTFYGNCILYESSIALCIFCFQAQNLQRTEQHEHLFPSHFQY